MCVTECQGPTPILDRTKEHLCSGDQTTGRARRMLLRLAKRLREQSATPLGVREPEIYRVRGTSVVVPDNQSWVDAVKDRVTVARARLKPPRAFNRMACEYTSFQHSLKPSRQRISG